MSHPAAPVPFAADRLAGLHTYRALRVGLVAAGLMLIAAAVIEAVRVGGIPGSVSALFYTPARTIFTGVLLVTGLAIVAIRGRAAEDPLLDVAGALVPLVALVPTPVKLASVPGALELGYTCPDVDHACTPGELDTTIASNVLAYALAGAVALAFAWWRVVRGGSEPGRGRSGAWPAGGCTAVLVLFGGWYLLGRTSFLAAAHYTAAIAFFAALIVVVWLSSRRRTRPRSRLLRDRPRDLRPAYRAIAVLMAAGIAAAGVLHVVLGEDRTFDLVFWIEIWLLVLFIAFWVLQTVELWDETEPPA